MTEDEEARSGAPASGGGARYETPARRWRVRPARPAGPASATGYHVATRPRHHGGWGMGRRSSEGQGRCTVLVPLSCECVGHEIRRARCDRFDILDLAEMWGKCMKAEFRACHRARQHWCW
jgi:hypothetical protein